MIDQKAKGIRSLHCLMQVLTVTGYFWLWTLVIFNRFSGLEMVSSSGYTIYSMLIAGALVVHHLTTVVPNIACVNRGFVEHCRIGFHQTAFVLMALLVFLVGLRDVAISRLFLFSMVPGLFIVLSASNALFPRYLVKWVLSGARTKETLLVGSREEAARMLEWFDRKPCYGIRPIGLLTEAGKPGETVGSLPVVGGFEDLAKQVEATCVLQIIAVGTLSTNEISRLADQCEQLGVRFQVAHDFEGALGRRVSVVEDDGIHFMGFLREPLESPFNQLGKRILDLLLAVPVVVFILPPLSLIVWLLQRWQSPGPLFFRQKRSGLFNEPFVIIKFRTMHVDHGDEARQATRHDSRFYPVGALMRRFSIDEIPQFLNVVRGDMSVVGPRPHLPEHDELFKQLTKTYGIRRFIKPGITGLAQVRDLRGETKTDKDVIERVRSDLDYLENWSFLLDAAIMARTAWKMFFPPKTSY